MSIELDASTWEAEWAGFWPRVSPICQAGEMVTDYDGEEPLCYGEVAAITRLPDASYLLKLEVAWHRAGLEHLGSLREIRFDAIGRRLAPEQ